MTRGRRAKKKEEEGGGGGGGGPRYTTLVYFAGTRQRCSTYMAHFATRLASGS